ncbi:unnamed protein product [Gongylonema pulchrum]|uniref:CAP-Gly domain-containing protein n=1 Tax=Gongylonema pulchrum TaxID=637853 RepID=A0A183E2D7_9BILA|nr:unnamed protein product [Gongylonema pulchrum]
MAAPVVSLRVTADYQQYPYEKRYPSSMTLRTLKDKLQLVVGWSSESMRTELRDKDGQFLSFLTDDQATLEQLGVQDGMQIHVTHSANDGAAILASVATVEKYTISEEKYNEREDSVRAWKQREGLELKSNVAAEAEKVAKEFEASCLLLSSLLLKNLTHEFIGRMFEVGDRCIVKMPNQTEKAGFVSYVGLTNFKPGYWIGVTYDAPLGKHDGSVDGVRYFTCENGHGAFVRPQFVRKQMPDAEVEEI